MASLLGFTAGGVALFNRGRPLATLSRAHRQLFYGICKYVQRNGHELTTTVTEGTCIAWRTFEPGIFLMYVYPNEQVDDLNVDGFVELLFNSLVFLMSKEGLSSDATSLRLGMRSCFGFLDFLLQDHVTVGRDFGCVDVALTTTPAELQELLNSFCEQAGSNYGAILAGSKCVAATEPFWELASVDAQLVCAYATYLPQSDAFDGPVFLPQRSPNVPHRFVRLRLMQNLFVVILCGGEPPLHTILDTLVPSVWKSSVPLLQNTAKLAEAGLPPTATLNTDVLGVLAVDPTFHRCLCTTPCADVQLGEQRRPTHHILRAWYKQILDARKELDAETHHINETYSCHKFYSSYALLLPTCHVLVLINSSVPTFALKAVAQETASTLAQHGFA